MALHQSRVAERERLVDAPLKTSIIREREEKQREARYPTVRPMFLMHRAEYNMCYQTRIRVKFPDQTQLERVFPSTDKIRSVYAFVRGSLREDVKPVKFVLCTQGLLHSSEPH
jgi:tether containing UBX domain for GLUT4